MQPIDPKVLKALLAESRLDHGTLTGDDERPSAEPLDAETQAFLAERDLAGLPADPSADPDLVPAEKVTAPKKRSLLSRLGEVLATGASAYTRGRLGLESIGAEKTRLAKEELERRMTDAQIAKLNAEAAVTPDRYAAAMRRADIAERDAATRESELPSKKAYRAAQAEAALARAESARASAGKSKAQTRTEDESREAKIDKLVADTGLSRAQASAVIRNAGAAEGRVAAANETNRLRGEALIAKGRKTGWGPSTRVLDLPPEAQARIRGEAGPDTKEPTISVTLPGQGTRIITIAKLKTLPKAKAMEIWKMSGRSEAEFLKLVGN